MVLKRNGGGQGKKKRAGDIKTEIQKEKQK